MEVNLPSPICLQRAVQARLYPTKAETNAGNKDRFGRRGGSYKRNLVYELENLWKFVKIISVNTYKPIACVQRDYCSSLHLTKEAFAITCFGTTTTDLVMYNLQPAGRMSPAEIKFAVSPIRMDNLFFSSDLFNFVGIVKSGKQYLSYNEILACRMGRSRRLENLR